MQVRFIGTEDPTDSDVCEVFGLTFPKGEYVPVSSDIGARLAKNPTFEVKPAGRRTSMNED